jgi:hypothetical protein
MSCHPQAVCSNVVLRALFFLVQGSREGEAVRVLELRQVVRHQLRLEAAHACPRSGQDVRLRNLWKRVSCLFGTNT